MEPLSGYVKLALAAGLLSLGGLLGGYAVHTYDAAQLANVKLTAANQLKAVSDTAARAADKALETQKTLQDKLASQDKTHTQENADAKASIDSLRAKLVAGTAKLYVRVNPSAGGDSLPAGSGTGGVANGAAYAQLDGTTSSALVGITGDGDYNARQVNGLIDYVEALEEAHLIATVK